MNRRRALSALAAVCAAAVLAAPASAKAPDQTGWWFQPKDGATADVVPAPPDAPSDGLYLFEAVPFEPSGSNPFAFSAIRFTAPPDSPAALTLRAADGSVFTGADVRACPATSNWEPTNGPGVWSKRPAYNCAKAMAFGIASSDGAAMSWPLGPAFESAPGSGRYDVVLVPWGPLPFRVGVVKPGPEALEVIEGTDSGPVPSDEEGRGPAAPTNPTIDSEPGTSNPAAPAPDVVPEARPALAGGTTTPFRDTTRGQRVLAAVLLLALAGALWWFGSDQVRPARFLGSVRSARGVAGDRAAQVRGVGRFARPRRSRAVPL